MITASAIPASREQTSPAPPRLLAVLQQAAAERGHSVETIRVLEWTRRRSSFCILFLFHDKRHPPDMGAAEIEQFLTQLAVKGHVSARTQNQAIKMHSVSEHFVLTSRFRFSTDS